MPVCDLLGGRYGEDFHLYRAISQNTPEAMAENVTAYREEGYRRFQLKVGGDPDVDIQRIREVAGVLKPGDRLVADANTGWTQEGAMCDETQLQPNKRGPTRGGDKTDPTTPN